MIRRYLTFLSFFIAFSANANDKWYGGVQFGSYDFESDDQVINFNPKAEGVSIRYMPYSYLGVETRIGIGLGSNKDEIEIEGQDVEISVDFDQYVSLYARGEYTFKYASIYALLGYSETQFTIDADDYDVSVTGAKGGVSYGVGIGVVNSDKLSFNLEYITLIEANTYTVNGINLSIQFLF